MAIAADAPQMAVAPPVRMPILRESPIAARQHPADGDRDDNARDDQPTVVPAQASDLLDGDARSQQRNAETQDAPRGEVDASLGLPLGDVGG